SSPTARSPLRTMRTSRTTLTRTASCRSDPSWPSWASTASKAVPVRECRRRYGGEPPRPTVTLCLRPADIDSRSPLAPRRARLPAAFLTAVDSARQRGLGSVRPPHFPLLTTVASEPTDRLRRVARDPSIRATARARNFRCHSRRKLFQLGFQLLAATV